MVRLNFKIWIFLITLVVLVIPILVLYGKAKKNTATENEKLNFKIAFFANNFLLYLLTIAICGGVLSFYFWLTNSQCINTFYKDLIGTGIFLPFVLWSSGLLIRELYKLILYIFSTKDVMKDNEKGKEAIFSVSLLIIICIFLSSINVKDEQFHSQSMFLIFILAVLIGKYIWLDTTSDKLINNIKENWDSNKYNVFLGVLVLSIMLVMRFLPNLISIDTALNIGFGLLAGLVILTGKAIYDYKSTVSDEDQWAKKDKNL